MTMFSLLTATLTATATATVTATSTATSAGAETEAATANEAEAAGSEMFSDADVAEVRRVVQRILVPCVFVIGLLGNSVSIYVLTR